jgi:2-oxoisovalerate dehydrogenase E1 component
MRSLASISHIHRFFRSPKMSLSELHLPTTSAFAISERESGLASIQLLTTMALSRECDRRESILFRQGKGYFQMPTAGHEAMAGVAEYLRPDDYVWPYYRDRALVLSLGTPLREIALSYFAKRNSSSSGRQMPNHFSDHQRNIVSAASPTGLQCLPAAGTAWACRLSGSTAVSFCCTGEAATREGEFYEAWCFAVQEKLGLVIVVEDNGYGISTPTALMNPMNLGVLGGRILHVDGRDAEELGEAAGAAIHTARTGGGPTILWAHMDRLMSHTSSDDHRIYRSPIEIQNMTARDPITQLRQRLIADGTLDSAGWDRIMSEVQIQVEECYRAAESEADPEPVSTADSVLSAMEMRSERPHLHGQDKWTIKTAFQHTMHDLLSSDHRIVMFGQDIEDPKGGVFGLTKGLSTAFPERVRNAPLAEATIAGLAAGLAVAGYKPVFELQFIDFVATAINQIANQIATMRWRTGGRWNCPVVLYAPCGGYLPAGGPWHSQTNEGWFTHIPGLNVAVPSTPEDVASLLRAAVAGDDPVLMLIPKHLFRIAASPGSDKPVRFGEGIIRRPGRDATVVTWGNCVRIALSAADNLQSEGISAEVIDLRTLAPCDWKLIRESLSRTSRLVVVQEDSATSSFGEAIIAEVTRCPQSWDMFAAPPQLISRGHVQVGFHPIIEAASLPSVAGVESAIRFLMGY